MLALLGTDENPQAVAAVIARWNAFDLEAAVINANLCAAAIRTPQEWLSHPHAEAVAELPCLRSCDSVTAILNPSAQLIDL
jgi:crotonobetainyl-CoA:carnitine CoA-transferase CaiB-like acyl-CoA transferase